MGKHWPIFLSIYEKKGFWHYRSYLSKYIQSLKIHHTNTLHMGSNCVKGYLTKIFCFFIIHSLLSHKNYHVKICVLIWECIVQVRANFQQWYNSGTTVVQQWYSSGTTVVLIAFSLPSFVGTTNFMFVVACLVGPENNIEFCYLSWTIPQQQMSPVH